MKTAPGVAVLLLTLLAPGCSKQREQELRQIKDDEAVLQRATAAVNQVLHNAADCDAVKAALPEARERLNEAQGKLSGEASQRTLDALRVQVKRVADACS